jgi:hypothetical protein
LTGFIHREKLIVGHPSEIQRLVMPLPFTERGLGAASPQLLSACEVRRRPHWTLDEVLPQTDELMAVCCHAGTLL